MHMTSAPSFFACTSARPCAGLLVPTLICRTFSFLSSSGTAIFILYLSAFAGFCGESCWPLPQLPIFLYQFLSCWALWCPCGMICVSVQVFDVRHRCVVCPTVCAIFTGVLHLKLPSTGNHLVMRAVIFCVAKQIALRTCHNRSFPSPMGLYFGVFLLLCRKCS